MIDNSPTGKAVFTSNGSILHGILGGFHRMRPLGKRCVQHVIVENVAMGGSPMTRKTIGAMEAGEGSDQTGVRKVRFVEKQR